MALTPGTRIGPYELSGQVGVGGMGEVYRATDTNLKRSVAIKVLPEMVAKDTSRLARFQQEAEALAALNHPHVAQIYGLEKSAGITALVMGSSKGQRSRSALPEGLSRSGRRSRSRRRLPRPWKEHTNTASSTVI